MEKIDGWQVFWSILVALMSYVSVMITFFMKKLNTIADDVSKRQTVTTCEKYRDECERDCKESRQQRDRFIERLYHDAEEECKKIKSEVEPKLHSHATVGTAGEVVK